MLWGATRLSALCPHDEIDVALKDMKKSQHLIDGFAIIGLIEEPIELGCGGSKAPNNFTLGKRTRFDTFLRFEGQLIQ